MTRFKRAAVLAVVAALAVSTLALPASASHGNEREYKVTITNLTDGQLMTPYVVATHSRWTRVFKPGREASNGLQQLAENGGVPVLVDELNARRGIGDVQVAGAAPIAPGASVETVVSASWFKNRVSLAGMLICTNDGFGGLNSVRLPFHGEKTVYGKAYDAGTEKNTEAYADLVPPCDDLGQTGATNPELAEDGKVRRHRGIRGGADLSPDIHGWHGPVIKVTIERVG